MTAGIALFETAIGACGVAWGARAITGVRLPERSADELRARLLRRAPGAREAPPPPDVRAAIEAIAALLEGEPRDLREVALDLTGVPDLHQRVYGIARAIPPGATRSYGELAAALGAPVTAREVGRALARNPFALVVPCHRVVAAGGRPGGFSVRGGVALKLRLLAIEGALRSALAPAEPGDAQLALFTAERR